MSILGTKSKRKDHKLVGASLPQWVHGYLTLYCLAKGTTKSSIIKERLEAWIKGQREKTSDIVLCTTIACRINEQWMLKKAKLPTVSFTDFKRSVECELRDKGLHDTDIALITSKLIK